MGDLEKRAAVPAHSQAGVSRRTFFRQAGAIAGSALVYQALGTAGAAQAAAAVDDVLGFESALSLADRIRSKAISSRELTPLLHRSDRAVRHGAQRDSGPGLRTCAGGGGRRGCSAGQRRAPGTAARSAHDHQGVLRHRGAADHLGQPGLEGQRGHGGLGNGHPIQRVPARTSWARPTSRSCSVISRVSTISTAPPTIPGIWTGDRADLPGAAPRRWRRV